MNKYKTWFYKIMEETDCLGINLSKEAWDHQQSKIDKLLKINLSLKKEFSEFEDKIEKLIKVIEMQREGLDRVIHNQCEGCNLGETILLCKETLKNVDAMLKEIEGE